jgi:hypothetical protein
MRILLLAALGALAAVSAPLRAQAEDVPAGVYDCYGSGLAEGSRVENTAGQLTVSGAKFSVIGRGQYLSRGGKTGRFAFDGLTLSMLDGPYAGLRYHRVSALWTFRMLRANGNESQFMCPRNIVKNPRNPNSW